MQPSLFAVQTPKFSGFNTQVQLPRNERIIRSSTHSIDTVTLRFGAVATYQNQAKTFVQDESERLRMVGRSFARAEWDFCMQSSTDNREKMVKARERYQAAQNRPVAYARAMDLMSNPQFVSLDLTTRRGLEVLKDKYETYIPRPTDPPEYWPLRQKIKAREVELMQIMNTHDEEDLIEGNKPRDYQQTYAEMLVDLVKDRNRLACMRHYPNFYVMELREQGLDPSKLQQYCEQLKRVLKQVSRIAAYIGGQKTAVRYGWPYLRGESAQTIESYKRERSRQPYLPKRRRDAHLMSQWKSAQAAASEYDAQQKQAGISLRHLLRGKGPEEILHNTARAMGIPQRMIDEILAKSDLYPRENKDGGAGCSPIDLPFEVQAFTNINPDWNQLNREDTRDLLHEVFGHGVDFKAVNPELPAVLRNQNYLTKESFATMMEMLPFDKNWAAQVLGANPQNGDALELELKWSYLSEMIRDLRREVANVEFERSLYEKPDQDLDELAKKKNAFAWGIKPENVGVTPGYWAIETNHLTDRPVTYQNYLLGNLWGAQVIERLERSDIGGFCTKKAGKFLLGHRSNGLLYTPEEEIVRMTGKPLSADAMIDRLQRFADELLKNVPQPKSA